MVHGKGVQVIILDMGSGNTCRNDRRIVERMIRDIAQFCTNKVVVLKWQLFKEAPPNIPLDHECFKYAYDLAWKLGYITTSSVFDIESMRYLMQFDVPFVKIACRPDLYELAKYSTKPVYVSTAQSGLDLPGEVHLACVRKYPATIEEYEKHFTASDLLRVSDHTVGWELYYKYRPEVIEKHFVHERVPDNPDAGPFAVTPDQLAEVLC